MIIHYGIENWGTISSIIFYVPAALLKQVSAFPPAKNIAVIVSDENVENEEHKKIVFAGGSIGQHILPQHLETIKVYLNTLQISDELKNEMTAQLSKINHDLATIESKHNLSKKYDDWGIQALQVKKMINTLNADKNKWFCSAEPSVEGLQALFKKENEVLIKLMSIFKEIDMFIESIKINQADNLLQAAVLTNLEKTKMNYQMQIDRLNQARLESESAKLKNNIQKTTSEIQDQLKVLGKRYESKLIISVSSKSKELFSDIKSKLFGMFAGDDLRTMILNNYLLSLLKDILVIIFKNNLLNAENVSILQVKLAEKTPTKVRDYLMQVKDYLQKVSEVDLLIAENTKNILNSTYQDKSCPARIDGTTSPFFGVKATATDKTIVWSHYCTGVERKIAKLIKEDASMLTIFEFAQNARRRIAQQRDESENFGISRSGKPSPNDEYSDKEDSTTNPAIFADISKLALAILEQEKALNNITVGEVKKATFTFKKTLTTDGKSIPLPNETMTITFNKDKQNNINILSVLVNFQSLDINDFKESLNYFDKAFRNKVKNKEYADLDIFLHDCGNFLYHIDRFYPLLRGTGASLQWIIRGLILYQTGVEIGDIRLGPPDQHNRIPFDVYAQLLQDPEKYANDFQHHMKPLFRNEQAQPTPTITNNFRSK